MFSGTKSHNIYIYIYICILLLKEFKVGCYCADRGFLYHDLHHCKQQLTESCSEKVKIKADDIESYAAMLLSVLVHLAVVNEWRIN